MYISRSGDVSHWLSKYYLPTGRGVDIATTTTILFVFLLKLSRQSASPTRRCIHHPLHSGGVHQKDGRSIDYRAPRSKKNAEYQDAGRGAKKVKYDFRWKRWSIYSEMKVLHVRHGAFRMTSLFKLLFALLPFNIFIYTAGFRIMYAPFHLGDKEKRRVPKLKFLISH